MRAHDAAPGATQDAAGTSTGSADILHVVELPWDSLPPVIVERLRAAGVTTIGEWKRQRLSIFGIPATLAVRVDYAIAAMECK